jgi:signal transduction histidine kinase
MEANTEEKTISIDAYTDANKLVLQVKDNGTRHTAKAIGTGHSLKNCKAIVESHEGTLDITSEGPGKGTVTTIGFKILAA